MQTNQICSHVGQYVQWWCASVKLSSLRTGLSDCPVSDPGTVYSSQQAPMRCATLQLSTKLQYFSVHTAYTRCSAYTRHRCSKCLRRCSVLLDSLCTRKCIVISTAVVSATRRCVDDVLFMMSTAVICSYFVWQLLPPPLANIYSAVAVDVVQFDWKLQTETSVKTAPNILIFLRLYLLKN